MDDHAIIPWELLQVCIDLAFYDLSFAIKYLQFIAGKASGLIWLALLYAGISCDGNLLKNPKL